MYYPCSENKDADQLRGYREADLRLCFRPCKLLVFSRTGSYVTKFYLLIVFWQILFTDRAKEISAFVALDGQFQNKLIPTADYIFLWSFEISEDILRNQDILSV